MDVLIVVEPGIDGVFRHVEGLIQFCLRQDDIRVHLAYSDRRGSEALLRLVETVRAAGGECMNLHVGNRPSPADLPAFLRLFQLVRRIRPVVIHGHSSKAGILARALRLLGVKASIFYTPNAYYGLGQRPSRIGVTLFNAIERMFGGIGVTINISHDEVAFAQKTLHVPQDRIRRIHNPVDTSIFLPPSAESRADWRNRLGLPQDAVILGSVGRLSFQKDPQTMYRAFALALKQAPDLRLFHLGQGEFADELSVLARELGIEDRLIRRSYLDEPKGFYQAVDALIFTSRYEAGWPIVALEALAADLPLVATTAPGTSDIGDSGLSHCWTAACGDDAGFSKAIHDWLDDRGNQRPSNHRQIAIERFSVERSFGAVLAEYRAAAKASL